MSGLPRLLTEDLDAAFEDVVLGYQDGLYAFAVSLCGDPGDGEEMVQEAFVRAYRALRSYDPERRRRLALKPWLYRITLNVFRNSLRARRPLLVLMGDPPDQVDGAEGPEQAALRLAERAQLLRALGCLPEAQRAALVLRYSRDMSLAEIADVLEQPVGTVKSNIHRGLATLRRHHLQEVS